SGAIGRADPEAIGRYAAILRVATIGLDQWSPAAGMFRRDRAKEGALFLMAGRDTQVWMWSEACEMLARAERLHRQSFRLRPRLRAPAWEPPADVLETEREVLVIVSLPGVNIDAVEVAIEDGALAIRG